jgi:hypothetical protein
VSTLPRDPLTNWQLAAMTNHDKKPTLRGDDSGGAKIINKKSAGCLEEVYFAQRMLIERIAQM